jgi:hypothetical protein
MPKPKKYQKISHHLRLKVFSSHPNQKIDRHPLGNEFVTALRGRSGTLQTQPTNASNKFDPQMEIRHRKGNFDSRCESKRCGGEYWRAERSNKLFKSQGKFKRVSKELLLRKKKFGACAFGLNPWFSDMNVGR